MKHNKIIGRAIVIMAVSIFMLSACSNNNATSGSGYAPSVSNDAPVQDVTFTQGTVTLSPGESQELSYKTYPDNADIQYISWSSSNQESVTVEGGTVHGVSLGTSQITIEVNGKEASCAVQVRETDLIKVYNSYCNPDWATVASDGSSLSLDSKPQNEKSSWRKDASEAHKVINNVLGFPSSLSKKMGSTTEADGSQTYSDDIFTVNWVYNETNGLEVTYKKN